MPTLMAAGTILLRIMVEKGHPICKPWRIAALGLCRAVCYQSRRAAGGHVPTYQIKANTKKPVLHSHREQDIQVSIC
jgi:hypothetical protein